MSTKKEIIEPENQADHEIGLEVARVLGLKRKRSNGRIETTHGDKTPCGLIRTIRSVDTDPTKAGLLNMLQRMVDETSGGSTPCLLTLEQARAAIAKAS